MTFFWGFSMWLSLPGELESCSTQRALSLGWFSFSVWHFLKLLENGGHLQLYWFEIMISFWILRTGRIYKITRRENVHHFLKHFTIKTENKCCTLSVSEGPKLRFWAQLAKKANTYICVGFFDLCHMAEFGPKSLISSTASFHTFLSKLICLKVVGI